MLGLYLYTFITGHKFGSMWTKWINIAERIAHYLDLSFVWMKKEKTQQHQQNNKATIKVLAKAGNWTWDLSHRSPMRYLLSFTILTIPALYFVKVDLKLEWPINVQRHFDPSKVRGERNSVIFIIFCFTYF